MTETTTTAALPSAPAPNPASTPSKSVSLWSKDGFGFKDILDIINPLQHLPVIGSIYRYLTGDEMSGGSRIVGDALYGGPIGFGVGVVSTLLMDSSGRDLGERTIASVFGPSGSGGDHGTTMMANNAAPPAPATQTALVQPATTAMAAVAPAALPSEAQTQMAATLYRSPAVAAQSAPVQDFMAQNPQFQRQLAGKPPQTAPTLNAQPIPLTLTGNSRPTTPAATPSPPRPPALAQMPAAPQAPPPGTPPANPIAQKMLNALDKYERMKKQEQQGDNGTSLTAPALDLAL